MTPERMVIERLDRIIQLLEFQLGIEHSEPADGKPRRRIPETPNYDR